MQAGATPGAVFPACGSDPGTAMRNLDRNYRSIRPVSKAKWTA